MVLILCEQCLQSFEDDRAPGEGSSTCPGCSNRAEPAPVPSLEIARPVEPGPSAAAGFFAGARTWCTGRAWLLRAPLLVYFAVVLVRHLSDPRYTSVVDALNFGLHELGHFVFRPFGEFLTIAGGTLAQLIAPVVSMEMFRRQRDYFAIACCFGWLSTSLFSVATYCADARAMQLTLLVPGGGILSGGPEDFHDWHRMLTSLGLLQQDTLLAFLFRCAAVVSMLAGLLFGAWLCSQMIRLRERR